MQNGRLPFELVSNAHPSTLLWLLPNPVSPLSCSSAVTQQQSQRQRGLEQLHQGVVHMHTCMYDSELLQIINVSHALMPLTSNTSSCALNKPNNKSIPALCLFHKGASTELH
jgi:hypothetical protein